MSAVGFILVILAIGGAILKGLGKKQGPMEQPRQWPAPDRTRQETSAYEWIYGSATPADQMNHPAIPDDDDLRLLQPSVHVDLTEMRESVHESVHELHETVHVRHPRTEQTEPRQPAQAPIRAAFPHGGKFNQADLARALVLGEVLGEPRAKRPWRPKTRR